LAWYVNFTCFKEGCDLFVKFSYGRHHIFKIRTFVFKFRTIIQKGQIFQSFTQEIPDKSGSAAVAIASAQTIAQGKFMQQKSPAREQGFGFKRLK
jgi:hypothetical protein